MGERHLNFIYVGRLDEIKGIKLLFEAWKKMNFDAPRLIVCGTGPLEEWCKKFIEYNGMDSIEMRGKVDNQEAKRLMAESEALILPSLWYEGFPMTIVEAYSVGCPVIGSKIGNVGCLIENGVTGWLINPKRIETLMIALKQPYNRMRRRTLDRYNAIYDSESNYVKLEKVYSQIEKKLDR